MTALANIYIRTIAITNTLPKTKMASKYKK
jgi:hypothetical protein